MIPRTSFIFDRQRILVAGEDSPALRFAVATLRHDGHCVSHVGDPAVEAWDVTLRECHLLIAAGDVDGEAWNRLLDELEHRLPGLALLRLTELAYNPPWEGTPLSPDIAALPQPFTAEQLRAAVRPLLPQLRAGSVLARASG